MISKTSLRNLTILLGGTTTVLAATIISPALPGMTEAFAQIPDADVWVKRALTFPALFIAIGALFAGSLLDRWGRKPILIISLVLYGVAGTAGYFLDSLVAILVSRALLGIAVAGIMSGFTTLILDYFKGEDLNRFLGLNGAFIGLGGMIFLLLAGFLAEFGWHYPFLIHLFAFIILPGVIFFIDEPQREQTSPSTGIEKTSFPWRKLAPIYLTAFVGMVIFFIFPVQIPFRLGEASTTLIGLALSIQTLSSVVAALQFQRLKARFSFLAITSLIFLAFSINHFIVALSPAYLVVIIGLVVGGLGVGLFAPNNSGWLASATPVAIRGLAVGGMTSALFLGQFASPFIMEPFVERLGLSGAFALSGIAALLVTMIFAVSAVRHKEINPPGADRTI